MLLPERTGRAVLDTIPLVTVSDSPSGAPTATTAWPTVSASDLAKVAGFRLADAGTLITARSVVAAVPTIVASATVPSSKVTRIWPDEPAPDTTWSLVRMWPSVSSTTPVPRPPPCPERTVMVTTDGSIFAAAAATVPSSFGVVDAGVPVTLIGALVGSRPEVTSAYEPMPAPAPMTADMDAATSIAASRGLRRPGGWSPSRSPELGSGGTPAGAGKSCGRYPGNRSIGTVGSWAAP